LVPNAIIINFTLTNPKAEDVFNHEKERLMCGEVTYRYLSRMDKIKHI
jgi:hypothetical protein